MTRKDVANRKLTRFLKCSPVAGALACLLTQTAAAQPSNEPGVGPAAPAPLAPIPAAPTPAQVPSQDALPPDAALPNQGFPASEQPLPATTPDPTPPAAEPAPLAPLSELAVAAEPKEVPPTVKSSKEGFSLQSDDKSFVLKFRGYIQADTRLFFDDVDPQPAHTFLLRRVRPIFEGTLYQYFSFRLMPDFGGGQTTIQDAHVDVKPLKEVALRFGKYKAPFGLERLQSATNILFVERALPTQLAPNRDVGAQVYGDIADTLSYALGIFNGVPDGGSADADLDRDKEFVGRLFAHPFRPLGVDALKDFGVGVAVSTGSVEGTQAAPTLPTYRSAGQQAIFRYRAGADLATTVVADGARRRVSPQLYYYYGPFGVLGEYVASSHEVGLGDETEELNHQAWQASATLVLGGKVSYEGVKPDSAVGEGGIGAFELSGRYEGLRIDRDAFPVYANPAASVRDAQGFGVGVGWWANRAARFLLNFQTTSFEGGAAEDGERASEKVVLARSQIAW
ncbi:MAG TPA: porin [Polyangiaceae bacterium]|nr:porin [Polyangiaceae bacterium]